MEPCKELELLATLSQASNWITNVVSVCTYVYINNYAVTLGGFLGLSTTVK
jgi:hypothetical protein